MNWVKTSWTYCVNLFLIRRVNIYVPDFAPFPAGSPVWGVRTLLPPNSESAPETKWSEYKNTSLF